MEDDKNGRQPKWKMTKMENDQSGRRQKRRATKMEDNQNGRRLEWKMNNQLYCYQTQQVDCKQSIICSVTKHISQKKTWLGVS